jgi:hypothetical protein
MDQASFRRSVAWAPVLAVVRRRSTPLSRAVPQGRQLIASVAEAATLQFQCEGSRPEANASAVCSASEKLNRAEGLDDEFDATVGLAIDNIDLRFRLIRSAHMRLRSEITTRSAGSDAAIIAFALGASITLKFLEKT